MSKPIFNSLGSNYSFSFAVKAIQQLWSSNPQKLNELTTSLESQFSGKVFLFYKGRDAIEFALRVLNLSEGDTVLTQVFTCHAIEEAISRAGTVPQFVDLAKGSLNPSLETIEESFKKDSSTKAKALIIQHTLGTVAPIQEIGSWCKSHNITLIEDLAQAFGGKTNNEKLLGSWGDVVICSFGRDKIIDAVSGGAVIFKNPTHISKATELYQKVTANPPAKAITKDMSYPLLTWLIRHTQQIGVGRLLFQIAKATHWLTSPVASPTKTMTRMPAMYAHLALQQLANLKVQLQHRQKIASIYIQEFSEPRSESQSLVTAHSITQGSNLRFPLWVDSPDKLTKQLTHQNIFITDRWYRQPVDSGSLNRPTKYVVGKCPIAEATAQHILNLPTHLGISEDDAHRIAQTIKKDMHV